MQTLMLDRTKCKRDGICVRVCPLRLMELDENGYPRFSGERASACVGCGHCVGVCAHDALELDSVRLRDFQDAPTESGLSPEQIARFFKTRRSVREFQDKPVPRDVLGQILDAACWAPSGLNRQMVEWLVVHGVGEVRHLMELALAPHRATTDANLARVIKMWDEGTDRVLHNAPALIVAHFPATASAGDDAIIAMTQVELLAHAYGLGVCWAGYFMYFVNNNATLRAALKVPADHTIRGVFMLGYPRYPLHRIPPRRKARITWQPAMQD